MKNITLFITIITSSFFCVFSFGQTNVPTVISTNEVWDVAGSPYILQNELWLQAGAKVTIMPGVSVESASNASFFVYGEIQALGTGDSMVIFDNIRIHLTSLAEPFNPVNQSGALFRYTEFINTTNNQYAIKDNSKGCSIQNSRFHCTGKGLMSNRPMTDSSFIEIINCDFDGVSQIADPILHVTGSKKQFTITQCSFENANAVNVLGFGIFKENSLNKLNAVQLIGYGHSNFDCNTFTGVDLGVSIAPRGSTFSFKNNTLDSCGNLQTWSHFPSLFVMTDSSEMTGLTSVDISKNNFLTQLGAGEKVRLTHGFTPPISSYDVDLTENYWQTSDSSEIADMIRDATDDSSVVSVALYGDFLNSMDTTCYGQSVVSTNKIKYSKQVRVYPNPVSKRLYVKSNMNHIESFQILSMDGKVANAAGIMDTSIDVSYLTPGVYILIVNGDTENRAVSRFVKL